MTGQYLVFQSNGYNFALPTSLVVRVHDQADPASVSFSEVIFGGKEPEPTSLQLQFGLAVSVASVVDITSIPRSLPLPGYIFDGDAPDWIRGAYCDDDQHEETGGMILILNEERIFELLNGDVSDLQA